MPSQSDKTFTREPDNKTDKTAKFMESCQFSALPQLTQLYGFRKFFISLHKLNRKTEKKAMVDRYFSPTSHYLRGHFNYSKARRTQYANRQWCDGKNEQIKENFSHEFDIPYNLK